MSSGAKMWSSVGLACVLGAGLGTAACTDYHEPNGSLKPRESTETGNPPTIDTGLVALVVSSDAVHVRGEPGAVTPGGITIEVERLGSGDVWRGSVAENGSFDVAIGDTPDDAFELRAIGAAHSSRPVYVLRDGATVGDTESGSLSCEQRTHLASLRTERAAADADVSCTSDDDCTTQLLATPCHASCTSAVVSHSGRAAIDAAIEGLASGLCADFSEDGCSRLQPPCPSPPGSDAIGCIDGTCRLREPAEGCTTCLDGELTWGFTNFFGWPDANSDGNRYTLSGCGDLTVRTIGFDCSSQVPRCDGGDAPALQDLFAALADPDVTAALESGGYYFNRPPGPDEPWYTIEVDNRRIDIGGDCEADAPCIPLPAGVAHLRDTLDAIARQHACTPSECMLSFDPGTGDAEQTVYAYDPAAGVCVPQIFNGTGGNENRFGQLLECMAHCPPRRSDPGCPPDRVYHEAVCIQPSPIAGCSISTPACARVCSSAADCAGDPISEACWNGICQQFSPL